MCTQSFIAALKQLSNNRAVVEFDARHITYKFTPAVFWSGFESDVKQLRTQHDIASKAYDQWVNGAIERQLHVEWNPARDLTAEEEADFHHFVQSIRADWRDIQDRRTAEHNRLCG